METYFSAVNMIAMAGWIGLLVAPRHRTVTWWFAGLALPALLAVIYLVLLATHAPGTEGGFSSLAGVTALFANPGVLLAGWVHYLAFDLFIGAWICRRGAAEGVNPWLVRLCLPPTFLAGPIGLLLFLGIRAARGRVA